jgi:hypothetical protein
MIKLQIHRHDLGGDGPYETKTNDDCDQIKPGGNSKPSKHDFSPEMGAYHKENSTPDRHPEEGPIRGMKLQKTIDQRTDFQRLLALSGIAYSLPIWSVRSGPVFSRARFFR